ncbi:MAG: paraquat-inducible protein A [Bdellovibrio bacteriovorus]
MTAALFARRVLALLCFAAALGLTLHLIGELNRIKGLKTDLAEINNVRYGLLDADQWLTRVSAVLERRIQSFELTEANRPQIKRAVEQALTTLLTQVEQYLRQRNQPAGGSWLDQVKGAIQQGLQDLLVDFDALRRKVPEYADLVVEELAKPEAKREIQAQLSAFLRQAADASFAKTDRSKLDALLVRHGCAEPPVCTIEIDERVAASSRPLPHQMVALFALVGALFLICLSPRAPVASTVERARLDRYQLTLLTGGTLILLAGGILTPMIEIEARITDLRLQLLGEPVIFTDQVLYFQTKSVFDVVSILARAGGADNLLVAILIVLFSVVFPALKVIATYVYYYDFRGLRHAAPVHFFALRSAKWSMADVLVIAIFMAYIGFSGLVGSQLGTLSRAAKAVEVITTNGTTLAPGFYLFLGFVLASLLLSSLLEGRIGEGHST